MHSRAAIAHTPSFRLTVELEVTVMYVAVMYVAVYVMLFATIGIPLLGVIDRLKG